MGALAHLSAVVATLSRLVFAAATPPERDVRDMLAQGELSGKLLSTARTHRVTPSEGPSRAGSAGSQSILHTSTTGRTTMGASRILMGRYDEFSTKGNGIHVDVGTPLVLRCPGRPPSFKQAQFFLRVRLLPKLDARCRSR